MNRRQHIRKGEGKGEGRKSVDGTAALGTPNIDKASCLV